MEWLISLHYLPSRFLEEGYLKHQVIQTGMRRNKLMMLMRIQSWIMLILTVWAGRKYWV
jgi:hypothetical protein